MNIHVSLGEVNTKIKIHENDKKENIVQDFVP